MAAARANRTPPNGFWDGEADFLKHVFFCIWAFEPECGLSLQALECKQQRSMLRQHTDCNVGLVDAGALAKEISKVFSCP